MSSRQWWAIVAALLLVGGVASFAGAQGIAAPLDLTQSLPSGIELSGFWRHSDEAGSEWRLTVRDPSGELLPLGTDGEPELAPATGAVQPAGASLAPTRSLLLDASGPRSSGGPDTLLVQTAQTSLVRNLGLSRVLDRLGLTDSVLVSASPGLQDFDFAYGVGRVLPPYLRFGSRQWAHFLIAEVQAERHSPEHDEPETSMLRSARAYWGRGWGWEGRRQSPEVTKQVAATAALGTASLEGPWGTAQQWRPRVPGHLGEHTALWQRRWVFSTDAAAYSNSCSDSDPAASLEARLTWRPDPFQPYGITLPHKRGREESDRERRINWTSLEFSYRF